MSEVDLLREALCEAVARLAEADAEVTEWRRAVEQAGNGLFAATLALTRAEATNIRRRSEATRG
jgi:hypothetical protein